MFTGIVEEQGKVLALEGSEGRTRLTIQAQGVAADVRVGESVAVDGVCLTVAEAHGAQLTADLSPETLKRTTLGNLSPGDLVNLERALRVGDSLGGHFVTGHVDGKGTILRREPLGDSALVWIGFPPSLAGYIAPKGSIAVDGVSLTVVEVTEEAFSVCLIPHTLAVTTLGRKGPQSPVNLEVDLLSRYLERLLVPLTDDRKPRSDPRSSVHGRRSSSLSWELLQEQGFA
jgi:riboflavin synthase